jgi:predicted dehydrogenase
MLGTPIERVSAWVTARNDGAPVEDIALARFETSEAAALVNVGWGVGTGGYSVSGRAGRIDVTYRDGSNGGWEPVEQFVVHGRSGRTEITDLPFIDGAHPLIAELADAIRAGRPPLSTGAQGAHILEATLAVYASAATGRTWDLPLTAGEPLYERGVAGLAELDLDPAGAIARKRIFGVG